MLLVLFGLLSLLNVGIYSDLVGLRATSLAT